MLPIQRAIASPQDPKSGKAKRHDVRNEFEWTHKRGQSTLVYDPILGPFLADVMRVRGQWCNGAISENDRDRRIMELEKQALAKVGQKRKEATCA
ncbi:hypothetical protein SH449x_004480 [Pirellulaceae bacterium SH449]